MDKLEFSIAMKLIKLKLQGVMLPTSLPVSMKQQPLMGGAGFGKLINFFIFIVRVQWIKFFILIIVFN